MTQTLENNRIIWNPHSQTPDIVDTPDDGDINLAIFAKTVGCITLDTVSLGGESCKGESEPVYDARYERELIKLVPVEAEVPAFRNANELVWRSGIEWNGPFIALIAYDDDGKKIARCNTGREDIIEAGMQISIKPEGATFFPILKEDK